MLLWIGHINLQEGLLKLKLSKLNTFYRIAENIASLSPDTETQVGAVAVHPDTYDVVLPSYNGFISGTKADLPTTRPDKYEYMVHAEMNLICQAARKGRSIEGYHVIQTLSPCHQCIRLLFQSGVRTIIFKEKYRNYDKEIEQCKDMDIGIGIFYDYTILELKPSGK